MPPRAVLVGLLVAAWAIAVPTASGGEARDAAFLGGTSAQRATVQAALERSTFPWEVLRRGVVVEIGRDLESAALPGRVTLDARLLDAGTFAWGVVQHEFAHQVDFQLLTDEDRQKLGAALGVTTWWGDETTPHSDRGAERFASLLAWAYWPSPENAMRPSDRGEAPLMRPAAFRALLRDVLGITARRASRAGTPLHARRP